MSVYGPNVSPSPVGKNFYCCHLVGDERFRVQWKCALSPKLTPWLSHFNRRRFKGKDTLKTLAGVRATGIDFQIDAA